MLYLSEQALVELTRRKQHKRQAKILASMGLRFAVRPDGSIALAQAEVDARLRSDRGPKTPAATGPDLAALG